jgi:cytochrome c-type biogenesis protein CcmH
MTIWTILAIIVSFAAGTLFAMLMRSRIAGEAHATADQSSAPSEPPAASPEPALAPAPASADATSGLPAGQRSIAAAALGAIAALAMVGLYASIEPPDPTSQRAMPEGTDAVERLAMLTQQGSELQPSAPQGGLASVDEMIERLAARLRQQPNDPEGWRMLGWSYFSTQRYRESATAYLKAIELRPDFAEFRSLRGEALVSAANGTITAEAMQVFDEALARDPAEPRARSFKALAKAQTGDKVAALEEWINILNAGDPTTTWHDELKQKATDLGRELGVDIAPRLRGRQAAASGDILKALAGPAPSTARPSAVLPDERATGTESAAGQDEMIRGMVERLAARLEQSPRDVEGWIKLMRSRIVLGETDRAKHDLERALGVFDNTPQERSQIAAAARALGILQ